MSRLYFFYSTMYGLKSAFLIDFFNNCKSNGYSIFILTHRLDNRYGSNISASRLGQKEYAILLDDSVNIFLFFLKIYKKYLSIVYILIDEVQFLTKKHIKQLIKIITLFPIFVFCFGLRSDFLKEPFKGSSYLLTTTDFLERIASYCFCGKYAVFNLRFDKKKHTIKKYGKKILIGGSELYTQVCRQHSVLV